MGDSVARAAPLSSHWTPPALCSPYHSRMVPMPAWRGRVAGRGKLRAARCGSSCAPPHAAPAAQVPHYHAPATSTTLTQSLCVSWPMSPLVLQGEGGEGRGGEALRQVTCDWSRRRRRRRRTQTHASTAKARWGRAACGRGGGGKGPRGRTVRRERCVDSGLGDPAIDKHCAACINAI